jgi:xanthine dehydrogenase accessory factor
MPLLFDQIILLRGGGDLASGVAHRLHRAGFSVVITELAQPLCVRRAVSFAEAVYAGVITVEGVTARLVAEAEAARMALAAHEIPVLVDPQGGALAELRPAVVVDARLAKRNLGTTLADAPLVIGLGPGFTAGMDCHAVVETNRGHNLGRVYWRGGAEPDTGQPEPVRGFSVDRVLRAPRAGTFTGRRQIGDRVSAGDVLAEVDGAPLVAPFAGVLRGLLHDGLAVTSSLKVGDLDPRGVREHCFTISDKARSVGGGVLEAVLYGLRTTRSPAHNPSA